MTAPVLTSLEPATAAISDPDFTIRVLGTGFVDGDTIVWMAADEPTTFVSDTELTTGVKPSVVSSPTTIPVTVRNAAAEMSNELTFTWTEAAVEPPTNPYTPDDPYAGNPQLPPTLPPGSDPSQAWDVFIVAATHAVVKNARNGVDFAVARPSKTEPYTSVHWDDAVLGPRPDAAIEAEARRLAAEWPSGVIVQAS